MQTRRFAPGRLGHEAGIGAVAISPEGDRVFTGSSDRTIRIWDSASGDVLLILHGHRAEITDLAITPDGRRLLSASRDATVRVWDTELEDARKIARRGQSLPRGR